MGQKAHAKWGGMVDSCLSYRTPDRKLEIRLRREKRILVLSFYASLSVGHIV